MSADSPHKMTMTPEQMDEIHQVIVDNGADGWVYAILVVFQNFGVDLQDPDGPSIAPWDYSIPKDQWQTICGWITRSSPGSDISRVNHGLDWMNKGPSAHDPAELRAVTLLPAEDFDALKAELDAEDAEGLDDA